MKTKLFFISIYTIILLCACEAPVNEILIRGNSENHKGATIYLVDAYQVQDYVSYNTALDSVRADNGGTFQFQGEQGGHQFYYLYDSNYKISECLYLKNGDSLSLLFLEQKDSLVGNASEVNQIIDRIWEIPFHETTMRRYLNGRDLVRLEPDDFSTTLNEAEQLISNLKNQLISEIQPDGVYGKYLDTYLNNWLVSRNWYYLEYHKYYGHDDWGYLPIDSLKNDFLKEWNRDSSFHFLSQYKENVLAYADLYYRKSVEGIHDTIKIPVEFKNKIQIIKKHLNGIEREIALTQMKNDYWMYVDVSDDFFLTLDTLNDWFVTHAKSDLYQNAFSKTYEKYKRIAPGKPAPNFTLPDQNGKMISLSDFNGKYVYLDFWGTWCWPCIQSIPDSRKLQQKFENNDKIIFLNVALEYDEENIKEWKNFLEENDYPGYHVVAEKQFRNPQLQPYAIQAAPTYVLIDKDGTILQPRADRPHEANEYLSDLLGGTALQ